MRKLLLLLLCSSFSVHAQNDEVINTQIKEIYRQVLGLKEKVMIG